MKITKTLKGAVVGKVFKPDEKEKFYVTLDRVKATNYECDARIYFGDRGEFNGGLILIGTQPREASVTHCFLRFTRYEALQFPQAFRNVLMRENRVVTCSIRRTSNGSIYEINYNRYGYKIQATANSLIELKGKFIEAVNAAFETPENAPQSAQDGKQTRVQAATPDGAASTH